MDYNNDIRMFVITHKSLENIYGNEREIFQVGTNKQNKIYPQNDFAHEDNISQKNAYFCELTGLYYIWKHLSCDVVCFEHYRRLFTKRKIYFFKYPFIDKKFIKNKLAKHDWILPKKYVEQKTVQELYDLSHIASDLIMVKNVLSDLYPDYIQAFNKVMNSNQMYYYNMFITTKQNLDNYCEWLFNILFKLEKSITYLDRDAYQQRVFGFLSERLLNVYIEYNNFNVYECNIEFIGNTLPYKNFINKVSDKLKK